MTNKMTAQEVIDRYKNRKRDFRRLDLRGQSFKGQNLSGADFSEADIRSANFANANLSQTNFSRATGGIDKRWWLVQQLLAALMGLLSGFLSLLSGVLVAYFFRPESIKDGTWILDILSVVLMAIVLLSLARQGWTAKAINSILLAIGVVVAVAVGTIGAELVSGAGAEAVVVAVFITVTTAIVVVIATVISVTTAITVAVFVSGAGAGTVAVPLFIAVSVAVSGVVAIPLFIAVSGAGAGAGAGAIAIAIAVLLFSTYIAWQTRKGNEKFHILRIWSNSFGAIGGTSFAGANLTGATFDEALLKNTNFSKANLTQVSWKDAKKLDFARWGESILANNKLRKLLVFHYGEGEDYGDLNLSGVNLAGAILGGANFKQTNLNRAILHHAILTNANLKEASCIETDFTSVELTGACIEGWNIDHSTKLDEVECQYVFLLEKANKYGSHERRPHDSDKNFESGDFKNLYRKIISTVELLLRGNGNPEAYRVALEHLIAENPEISRKGVEAVGDDVKVTLNVPKDSDKGKIERNYFELYAEAKLEAAKATAALAEAKDKHIDNLMQVILSKPDSKTDSHFTFNNTSTAMNDGKNHNMSTGANSLVNTGTINNSGTIDLSVSVTDTINQLSDISDPDRSSLKRHLTELQQAIKTDKDLKEPDKADLLDEVKNLATAAQTEEPAQKEKLTRKAKKIFDGTLKSLPDTAKIAEAVSKLLPLILKGLGVPI